MKVIKIHGLNFGLFILMLPGLMLVGFIFWVSHFLLFKSGQVEPALLFTCIFLILMTFPIIFIFISKIFELTIIDEIGLRKRTFFHNEKFSWSEIKKFDVVLELQKNKFQVLFDALNGVLNEIHVLDESEYFENYIGGIKSIHVSKTDPIIYKKWFWQKNHNVINIPFRIDACIYIKVKLSGLS